MRYKYISYIYSSEIFLAANPFDILYLYLQIPSTKCWPNRPIRKQIGKKTHTPTGTSTAPWRTSERSKIFFCKF